MWLCLLFLNRTIDRRKRLIIAMDAAFGMEYLHGKNIVHFDLKCENLLVNMRDPHRPVCKVGCWWLLSFFLNPFTSCTLCGLFLKNSRKSLEVISFVVSLCILLVNAHCIYGYLFAIFFWLVWGLLWQNGTKVFFASLLLFLSSIYTESSVLLIEFECRSVIWDYQRWNNIL